MQTDLFRRNKKLHISVLQLLWLLVSFLFFTTYFPWPSSLKRVILIAFGAEVGSGFVLRPNVFIKLPWKLKVGQNVWIGYGVFIDNEEFVRISDSVCISQHTKIFTGSHDFNDETFAYIGAPVTINKGSWIAACAVIAPGAELPANSFIKLSEKVK
jgi:putative colanic acid biosynthesis acetyltransferase WcaF